MGYKKVKANAKRVDKGVATAVKPPPPPPPVNGTGRRLFWVGAGVAWLGSLALYTRTMAPSAPFWDAGEFIASSYILGIPHSPGTPLYILIGRVFTLLPLPLTIAGKINFMSALTSSLAVLFCYLLVVRVLDLMLGRSQGLPDALVRVAGGLVGAGFLMFSDTFWWNAVEAEVYSMSTFLMGFMTWLALKWANNATGPKSHALLYLLFYLLALTAGLHLGTVIVFSGIFFLILMTSPKSVSNVEFLLATAGMVIFLADATLYRAGGVTVALLVGLAVLLILYYLSTKSTFALATSLLFVLGISVHLYLKIRSGHNPAIDEADPETWRNLYAVLRREQYPPSNIFDRKASWAFQFQHFNRYFQAQYQMFMAYLGKLNLGSVIPLALGVWGMVDHYAKHRKTFVMLFVTFLATSLGMIVYLNFSDAEVRERDYFYLASFYYFAIFIGLGAGSLIGEIKSFAARAHFNRTGAVAVTSIVLLIMPLFTLKHHFWPHDRSHDYICREYAKNMLVGLAPNAILFTNGDNDTFPLWYIQEVEHYRRDIRVVNLSLLNTPWYIKQLRDNEPKVSVPPAWERDSELKKLRPVMTNDGIILIRDIAVNAILKQNASKRPIYFAVTIPPEIFEPYREHLEMEGLAYRVVSTKGRNQVNLDLLTTNIWDNYNYAGILTPDFQRDDSIYKPPFVRRLVQNYAAAFAQLGFSYVDEEEYDKVVKNLQVAKRISPDMDPVVMWLGWYMFEAGDTLGGIDFYKSEFARRPDRTPLLWQLAGLQERKGDLPAAVETLEELTRLDPDNRDAVLSILQILLRFGLVDRGQRHVDQWLRRHPDDNAMRQFWKDAVDRLPPDRQPSQGGQ